MTDYLLLILADILLALNFAATKAYQKNSGTSLYTGLLFNAALGFFSALLFFTVNGAKCALTPFSAVMALLMRVLCVAYTCLGFKIMDKGNMTIYTVFLMIGGVSYLFQLKGAINLPATVLYPFITGGSIIFTALAGRVFFGEKPKKRTLTGIALCFLGTVLFL